ncbi:MAG: N-acetylornithine aminotransferase (EC [uncultured Paraburkholderia sp.]|nr:MAG: N-acetylornithine aminotransferase (EC [uncultured Paraburkholderia sp.]CAH2922001.1 MAG: N-acetylornithine aminotransferase (EC [uncultured Paraburkholderia sp.]
MNFNEYPTESLMYITNRPEIVFTHGKGSWLYDNNGERLTASAISTSFMDGRSTVSVTATKA